MKRIIEIACALGGITFAVLFGIGFLAIAQFVPPLDPGHTAEQTAAIYRENTTAIRVGLLLCYAGCVAYLAFGASITGQTRRIQGAPATLIHLQLVAFSASVLLVAGPMMVWLVAAFRPDEYSAETIQMLNDLGWITFLLGWVPFVTWYIATGVSILCDESPTPIYPRWAGYAGILLGFLQSTATFLVFTQSGPFAWNGLFSWWLPASEFFTWFMIMTVLTVKAVNRQYRSADPDAAEAKVGPATADGVA